MATILRNLGTFVLIALFLSACSSDTAGNELRRPPFEAAIGTFNTGSEPLGTSLYFGLSIKEPLDEEAVITVNGPDGWNDDSAKVRKDGPYPEAGYETGWTLYPGTDVVEGVYTVTALIGGETYTAETRVDPADALPAVGELDVAATTERVSVAWDAVAGAESYYVRVREYLAEGGYVTHAATYTNDTSVEFTDLGLSEGVDHAAWVYAFNVDLTQDEPRIGDASFETARTSEFFLP